MNDMRIVERKVDTNEVKIAAKDVQVYYGDNHAIKDVSVEIEDVDSTAGIILHVNRREIVPDQTKPHGHDALDRHDLAVVCADVVLDVFDRCLAEGGAAEGGQGQKAGWKPGSAHGNHPVEVDRSRMPDGE